MKLSKMTAAIPGLLLLAVPAGAIAQDRQDTIEIRAISPLEQWQNETNRVLNKALDRAPSLRDGAANEAVVQVAFEVGADGRANNMRVLPGNGNLAAQRAARYAIRKIDTLGAIPAKDVGRPILANIFFYDNEGSYHRLKKELASSEVRRGALRALAANYIVIGSPEEIDAD